MRTYTSKPVAGGVMELETRLGKFGTRKAASAHTGVGAEAAEKRWTRSSDDHRYDDNGLTSRSATHGTGDDEVGVGGDER